MEYRTLSDSELRLSAITFGAWAAGGWMWGKTDRLDAVKAIQAAYDVGVTSIDTAPIYGQGTSEEIVGEAIKDIPRDKVQILTKFGMRWDISKGSFFMKSKDNDGKNIDIYKYAGNEIKLDGKEFTILNVTTPITESFEAVERLIQQGKVRYAGVCNFEAQQVAEADEIVNIISDQVPFSMVNREIQAETVPYCIKNNKSILAYSPLERGLLTGKMEPGHKFMNGDHRAVLKVFKSDNIAKTNAFLESIKPIADDKNITLAQLVLKWTLEQEGITIALAGARNAAQATQNAGAADVQLTSDELAFITQKVIGL
jgi:aryl-alcohol dehydrogenase-like predicted oxidoreductase